MKSLRHAMPFTLFEVIIAMALAGVLLTLTAPALRGFVRGRETQEEARRFLAAARYTASQAVSTGSVCELRIDPSANGYAVHVHSGRQHGVKQAHYLTGTVRIEVDAVSGGSTGIHSILWWPDGALEADGLTAIRMFDRDTPADAVVIVPNAMRTRLVIETENAR